VSQKITGGAWGLKETSLAIASYPIACAHCLCDQLEPSFPFAPTPFLPLFRFGLRTLTEGVVYIHSNLSMKSSAQVVAFLSLAASPLAAYDLVKTYSGNSFFDSWSYYGHYDNLTSGEWLSWLTIRTTPLTLPVNRGCHLRQPDDCPPAAAHIRELCRECHNQSRQYDICALQ